MEKRQQLSRPNVDPLRTRSHRRKSVKAWLVACAAALVVGAFQAVAALPAAADTGDALYASASSSNTTTPCTNVGDPCTLATAITEANADTDDTIDLTDGTYTSPSGGFPAVTSSQTWQGESENGTILSGVSGISAPMVTINSGAVVRIGTLEMTGGTDTNSLAGTIDGGAISNSGTLTLTNADISDNTPSSSETDQGVFGGGVFNAGAVILTQDTFDSDSADSGGGGADGGAIYNDFGTVTASDDSFIDNSVESGVEASSGGAIFSYGTLTIADDTFTLNSAGGSGGAILEGLGTGFSVVGSTFVDNDAPDGASIANNPGDAPPTTVADDFFSDAVASCDQGGATWTDDGYNVGSDSSCFSSTPATGDDDAGSILAGEVGSPADNGGPTPTIDFASDNPALGIIPNTSAVTITEADGTPYTPCPTVDQRGIPSPPGAMCNAGSVQSSFLTTVNGNSSAATITYGTEATFAETDGLPASGSGTVTFSSASPSATLCSFSYPTDTSCTTSPTLDAGTYSGIEATFTDTDGFYSNESAANVLSLTVNQATESTTTRLQESSSSVEFGQERFETFSATVTGQTGAGYPEGTVTVFDASRPLCSAPLGTGTGDAASARCSLSNEELNAGTYSDVYARFTPGGTSSSDSNDTYTGSVSSTKRFTVSPASTATTLTLTSPVTYGSEGAVDFHITVRATGAVPVGSILVLHNSTILCSTTLGPGGTGTCTLSAKQLKADTYSVTALYTPSSENFLPSSSTPHKLVVRA
jgi:hypothetical protein